MNRLPPRRYTWILSVPFILALVALFTLSGSTNLDIDVTPTEVKIASSTGDDVTLVPATSDTPGLLSAQDKQKLDAWSWSGHSLLLGTFPLVATSANEFISTGLYLPSPNGDADSLTFKFNGAVNIYHATLLPLRTAPPSVVGDPVPSNAPSLNLITPAGGAFANPARNVRDGRDTGCVSECPNPHRIRYSKCECGEMNGARAEH